MRLVDADALDKTIYEQIPIKVFGTVKRMAAMREIIQNAPTVDAVPVVRCKDCKWWDKQRDSPYGYCHACKHGHMSEHWEIGIYRVYKGDWFCADGERR